MNEAGRRGNFLNIVSGEGRLANLLLFSTSEGQRSMNSARLVAGEKGRTDEPSKRKRERKSFHPISFVKMSVYSRAMLIAERSSPGSSEIRGVNQ